MRRAIDDSKCGIPWVNGGRLTDLDSADDIALMDNKWSGMTELTRRLEAQAEAVGLRINAEKAKLVAVGHMRETQRITAGGKQVESLEEFCYFSSVTSDNNNCD
jgi:hypothetical protein